MGFVLARRVAAAAQGRAQSSLQSRDHALGLPALPVLACVETTGHLPAVTLLGPGAFAARVEVDHGGADAQALAGHAVVGLGVVTAVGEQTIDLQVPRGP